MDNYAVVKRISLIVIFLILLNVPVFAVTYYMANNPSSGNAGWGNGSNSNTGTKAAPWLTMKYAAAHMSAGDTLIIDDGNYGVTSCLDTDTDTIPEGSAIAGYTTFQAENDGKVLINGAGTNNTLKIHGNDTVDGVTGGSSSHDYLIFRGIIYTNSAAHGAYFSGVNHIKVINCGFYNFSNGYSSRIYAASYILFEGCYAWGSSTRYNFTTYRASHVIFRTCVVRIDRSISVDNAFAAFAAYSSAPVEMQNCIVIDSDQLAYYNLASGDNITGAFGAPATYDTSLTGKINIVNCIALNNNLRFGSYDWNNTYRSDATVSNSIGWDFIVPGTRDFIHSQGNVAITNSTFGVVDTENGDAVTFSWYNGWKDGNTNTSEDNIYYNFLHGGLFYDVETADNNNIYGLGGNANVNGTTVTNTKTYSPLTSGLTYLVKRDASSQLETDDIGATVLYLVGTPGTLYGETGYNTLTAIKMWPFPNEALIREKMRAYTWDDGSGGDPEITGARGYCADDHTLTTEILNKLNPANPITVEGSSPNKTTVTASVDQYIYGESGETDTIDPVVAISDSDPKVLTSGYTTTLGFTSSDANGIDECKWRSGSAPDETHGTACTGTTSGTCSVTGLVMGDNTIYVGCADPSNNWGSDSITVNAPPYRASAGGFYSVH